MILQLVIGGGVLLGLRARRPKLKPKFMPNRSRGFLPRRGATTLVRAAQRLDGQYQSYFQTRLDPLFGAARRLHLEQLEIEVNEEEKGINRRLGLATANIGLATLGTLYWSPLLALSAVGAVYASKPLIMDVHAALWVRRRLTYSTVAALSLLSTLASGYFVTTNLVVFLIIFTKKVIYRTENYSRKGIAELFRQQDSAPVWALIDGVEVETRLEAIREGDILVVGAGQTIPIDGTITSGMATIDQHLLTGEAQPVQRGVGEEVFAATTLLSGRVRVRVKHTGRETLSAKIFQIMEETAGYHIDFESKGRNFADRAALPVLGAAALAWPTVGVGGAVAVLSGGFGSILKLSAPLSMLNFLNLASRHGVLIKDGRSLEVLDKIDTIVFDKTGTLTLTEPTLTRLHTFDAIAEEEVLRLLAGAEQRQSHPIARAIMAEAERRGVVPPAIDAVDCEVGFGIRALTEAGTLRVGSETFMRLEGIALPATFDALRDACDAQGHSLVLLARDERLVGAAELRPSLRPEAQAIVGELKRRGLELHILSGDQQRPTQRIAEALGIDHYAFEVLPQEKARVIERLQQQGRTVCFVGDGINDGIALRQADISVSLSGAATVAVDSAQIVLMDQSLNHLPRLIDLARDLAKNLQTTFTLSVVPGSCIIGGVFLFHFGIPAAMTLYSAGLLLSLGNVMAPVLTGRAGAAHSRSAPPDGAPVAPPAAPAPVCSSSHRPRAG